MSWPGTPGASPALRTVASLASVLLLLLPAARSQTLRVTTWNLEVLASRQTNGLTMNTNGLRISAAAKALRQLNPDVILLQQVHDWETCDRLAQALKPARYNVVVCSAFPEPRTGIARNQQVAILAKRKAYFTWTEAWHNRGLPPLPGGYAFAAFHVGKQQVGIFSVQAAPSGGGGQAKQADPARQRARSTAAAAQLLEQVGSVSNWVANRVEVFAVGGTFGAPGRANATASDAPLQILEEAGFGDACLEMPPDERVTLPGRAGGLGTVTDYLFTRPAGCTVNPRVLTARGFRHFPVTCEIGLGPAAAIAAQTDAAAAAPANAPKPEPAKRKKTASPSAAAKPASEAPTVPTTSPPAPPTAQLNPAPAPSTLTTVPTPAVASSHPTALSRPQPWLLPFLIGIAAAAGVLWFVARRRALRIPKPPALLTAGGESPSSYTVVVGTRSATEAASAHSAPAAVPQPIIHVEAPGDTQTQAEALRQRAQAAELRAERADAIIRRGLIPHLRQWLKQKLVRRLIADRAHMLETQHAAARKAVAVEARLARIEQQVQQQNHAYHVRIEELTRELLTAKEENRELIRARIVQVKAEMEAARQRLIARSDAQARGTQ